MFCTGMLANVKSQRFGGKTRILTQPGNCDSAFQFIVDVTPVPTLTSTGTMNRLRPLFVHYSNLKLN